AATCPRLLPRLRDAQEVVVPEFSRGAIDQIGLLPRTYMPGERTFGCFSVHGIVISDQREEIAHGDLLRLHECLFGAVLLYFLQAVVEDQDRIVPVGAPGGFLLNVAVDADAVVPDRSALLERAGSLRPPSLWLLAVHCVALLSSRRLSALQETVRRIRQK